MNAFVVEELLHPFGDFHIFGEVPTPVKRIFDKSSIIIKSWYRLLNVSGGNDPIAGQLPDVKLVNC